MTLLSAYLNELKEGPISLWLKDVEILKDQYLIYAEFYLHSAIQLYVMVLSDRINFTCFWFGLKTFLYRIFPRLLPISCSVLSMLILDGPESPQHRYNRVATDGHPAGHIINTRLPSVESLPPSVTSLCLIELRPC